LTQLSGALAYPCDVLFWRRRFNPTSGWPPGLASQRPYVTWVIRRDFATDQPCTVLFEPVGSVYELDPDDEVLIHLYVGSNRAEDADVEVGYGEGTITFWTEVFYRAWNKAGEELRV
jgi:hypothetical protein